MPAAVDLADFLAHLGMPATSPDAAEVPAVLEAATEAAEGRVGPIVRRPVTARASTEGGVLRLPHTPAFELTSVTGLLGAADLDVAGLDVDAETGTVRSLSGWVPSGTYRVEYVAGRCATTEDVPASLRVAIMIIGQHLWETQRGRALRPGARTQPVSHEATLTGFALPNRALQLLLPYAPVWVG